jgi:hypothetical protein
VAGLPSLWPVSLRCGRSPTEPLRFDRHGLPVRAGSVRGWRPAVERQCGVGRPAHNRSAGSGDPRTTEVRGQETRAQLGFLCCGRSPDRAARHDREVSKHASLAPKNLRPAVRRQCGVGRPAHNRSAGSGDPRTTEGDSAGSGDPRTTEVRGRETRAQQDFTSSSARRWGRDR